jgi:hypothetical protein
LCCLLGSGHTVTIGSAAAARKFGITDPIERRTTVAPPAPRGAPPRREHPCLSNTVEDHHNGYADDISGRHFFTDDKVALVMGAGSGIGQVSAAALARGRAGGGLRHLRGAWHPLLVDGGYVAR